MRLKDRVAIVTGGGSGIGKGISLRLAQEGADVVVASRNQERLDATAQEIRALGRRSLAISTDIRQYEQVEAMVQRTVEEFGRVDILVNNAAVHIGASFLDISEDDWFRTIDTIIHGTFRCCQQVGRVMARQGSGVVVNVLCPHAQIGFPWVHLCTAKSFQRIYTMGLSGEMSNYGVRVVGVMPGLVPTDGLMAAADPQLFQALAESGPLGRACTPEDVGAVVAFLASDDASFMTGCIVPVDGGTTALVRGGRGRPRPVAQAPAAR